MVVAQFFSGGVALRYVLPVLWMTSYFHIIDHTVRRWEDSVRAEIAVSILTTFHLTVKTKYSPRDTQGKACYFWLQTAYMQERVFTCNCYVLLVIYAFTPAITDEKSLLEFREDDRKESRSKARSFVDDRVGEGDDCFRHHRRRPAHCGHCETAPVGDDWRNGHAHQAGRHQRPACRGNEQRLPDRDRIAPDNRRQHHCRYAVPSYIL